MLHLGLSLRPDTEGKQTMEEAANSARIWWYARLRDLFAVILFSKASIPESVTGQFRRLAADVRVVLGKFNSNAVFSAQ